MFSCLGEFMAHNHRLANRVLSLLCLATLGHLVTDLGNVALRLTTDCSCKIRRWP